MNNTQFLKYGTLVGLLILGSLSFTDLRSRLDARALANSDSDLTDLSLNFATRLASRDDTTELLKIGHRLLTNHEPQLAAIAFDRVVTLTPGSRDGHLFLGWSLLASIEQATLTKTEAGPTLDRAREALTHARTLDPLDPRAGELLAQIETNDEADQ